MIQEREKSDNAEERDEMRIVRAFSSNRQEGKVFQCKPQSLASEKSMDSSSIVKIIWAQKQVRWLR